MSLKAYLQRSSRAPGCTIITVSGSINFSWYD